MARCTRYSIITIVKELRSKMFRQHPGSYKAVFLKKTQTIILSFDEYTVYIMLWIMMLYDWYCIIVIFCPNIIGFLQRKIWLFLKVLQYPAYKSLQSTEISLYVAFTNEWNVAKKEKILMNDLIYLALDIILLRKNQLVTSYSRKLLSTDIFEFRLCQIVKMYRNRLRHLLGNGFVSM